MFRLLQMLLLLLRVMLLQWLRALGIVRWLLQLLSVRLRLLRQALLLESFLLLLLSLLLLQEVLLLLLCVVLLLRWLRALGIVW